MADFIFYIKCFIWTFLGVSDLIQVQICLSGECGDRPRIGEALVSGLGISSF